MKQLRVSNCAEWRQWLAENRARENDGIWLVYYKKQADKSSVEYEESVEEALCFGWVDSLIKRIDENSYCRKFTPRKGNSKWSDSNKERVEKIIREGRMTDFGMAKIEAAKRLGSWDLPARPEIDMELVPEFSAALASNKKARTFFESLAQSHQRHFVGWIVTAKRPETRAKRVKESLALLVKGEKLGLK
jgi:uncharacterized protein YdeI (YjbR/CyaY-like superfamily)